jgi:hypothetical protein
MKASLLLFALLVSAFPCLASITISTTSLPNGTESVAYSAVIQASGGCTPYKWSIVSGALPAGVAAKASSTTKSLNLSGIPRTAMSYSPTLQVTGCGGGTFKASYKIVIRAASSVVITTRGLPNGTVRDAYTAAIKAIGGCTPYKWAIASGTLPAGISAKASSSTTSLGLTGTPTTAAVYSFTAKVTGCGGHVSEVSYKVAIQATTAGVAINTTNLPNGIVGSAYSGAVKASGGCTPYRWSVVSGALPAGVTAKASSTTTSLDVSGTPTTAAIYSPVVQVTECGGGTFKASYKVVIQATTNHVVDLSWKASTSSDVAGYNVYRSADGSRWKKINANLIASTLYNDPTVANGSTYYYAATAVDIYGHESSSTPPVKVNIP